MGELLQQLQEKEVIERVYSFRRERGAVVVSNAVIVKDALGICLIILPMDTQLIREKAGNMDIRVRG